jgi:hypothetical protein
MEIFELYDSARGSADTQREMTDEEADLRNEDLRAKQDSRRWIVYDCHSDYSISSFFKQFRRAVHNPHMGTLSQPHS